MVIAQKRYGQDLVEDKEFAHPARIYGKITILLSLQKFISEKHYYGQ